MKKLLRITALFLTCQIGMMSVVEGQNVGINEPNPDNSALLEMTSTERGLLVPRMTEIERDAIASPAEGLIIYNTNDSCLNLYRSNYWYNMCCCAASTPSTPTLLACGDPTTIVDVTSAGQTWMDRHLGAARAATASDDYFAYGSLFQWGRLSDGHECITWTSSTSGTPVNGMTSTQSSGDVPGHSDFIVPGGSPWDYRSTMNNSLWQGASGTNNPCPSGYRLPTYTELNAERLSWSSNNAAGAFASPLKFPVAGDRRYNTGALNDVGDDGGIWTSTVSGSGTGQDASFLYIQSGNAGVYNNGGRTSGFSCRCIKD
ncbi:MAG: hypothetical protein COB15_06545 [Flavobacteriales bacterium]|nr:MAG: hypothetical protein COB15_06545 [Flavobacteriales bacterium]